ncbi:hypothetical protein [Paenibacillus sp. SYP-B4298]|uniref:hypothetical protein n=1 Tax=Paenibacillus sp. SYP-B4298 TaxID=2996034 RepID=UPI0022DD7295|nr:hypothetical protein [Paenibacillus sp. SYP-B4298]
MKKTIRRRIRPAQPGGSYGQGYDSAYNEGYNAGFAKGFEDGHHLAYEQQG